MGWGVRIIDVGIGMGCRRVSIELCRGGGSGSGWYIVWVN